MLVNATGVGTKSKVSGSPVEVRGKWNPNLEHIIEEFSDHPRAHMALSRLLARNGEP